MFPILRGCVEFLLDILIKDESDGYLVTNPSVSPENSYYDRRGQKGVLCEGCTIDIQIVDAMRVTGVVTVKSDRRGEEHHLFSWREWAEDGPKGSWLA